MHGKKPQNTLTSLVQRENSCVQRISLSRDEILTIHDPLGYPQRGKFAQRPELRQLRVLCDR